MRIRIRNGGDLQELDRLIGQEEGAEQRDRYRAARLAIEGVRTDEIQQRLARSRRFVQKWAYTYRDRGIVALRPPPRPGAPPKLEAEQQRQFIKRFKAGPTPADGGLCTLRGLDATRILREEFGVNYSLNGVYKLLHRHGLSCLKPRPRHRKSDTAAQEQWLEQAPLLSRGSSEKEPVGS